jgi:Zn-dependent peptidase ImmA (M78 family)/DNA-binding transcriptional regulator YiaG
MEERAHRDMKNEPVAGIQPEVIAWARKSIGLSIEDVARELKRPQEEVMAWESGDAFPTYSQLEKLAYKLYKRPLAVFFLPSAPEETQPKHEFRTLPDTDLESLQKDTYLQIRRAHAYQLALKDLFGDTNPHERCIWKSVHLSPEQGLAKQAESIRTFLGITLAEQLSWRSDDLALKKWRNAIEAAGVFIFKAAFKQKDISGFCLMDTHLPVIYLNNSTTKTRQIFSLLHELAHLLLSMNGLTKFDKQYIERLPRAEQKIEQFCNGMAAEVLIPSADFAQQVGSLPVNAEQAPEDAFANIAARYGVSREAILRRLLDMDRVSSRYYEAKARLWTAQMKKSSGGDWYSNQTAYLSNSFTREVFSRHYRDQLSLEQAADYLGIKPRSFSGLEERILKRADA